MATNLFNSSYLLEPFFKLKFLRTFNHHKQLISYIVSTFEKWMKKG